MLFYFFMEISPGSRFGYNSSFRESCNVDKKNAACLEMALNYCQIFWTEINDDPKRLASVKSGSI